MALRSTQRTDRDVHWSDLATWRHRLGAVLIRHVATKAIGTTVGITLFFVAYFHLLNNPAFPATVMPVTWVDRAIPVEPLALPVYLSLWLYVSLPPALLWSRRELVSYGIAMGATCLVGLAVFYVWPTQVPAMDVDWSRYPSMAFLKGMDAAGNAFPSLHVATAVFSAWWMHVLLRRYETPDALTVLNWVWCIGIIYSTLATRQHVMVDVLSGTALGAFGAYVSLYRHSRLESRI